MLHSVPVLYFHLGQSVFQSQYLSVRLFAVLVIIHHMEMTQHLLMRERQKIMGHNSYISCDYYCLFVCLSLFTCFFVCLLFRLVGCFLFSCFFLPHPAWSVSLSHFLCLCPTLVHNHLLVLISGLLALSLWPTGHCSMCGYGSRWPVASTTVQPTKHIEDYRLVTLQADFSGLALKENATDPKTNVRGIVFVCLRVCPFFCLSVWMYVRVCV